MKPISKNILYGFLALGIMCLAACSGDSEQNSDSASAVQSGSQVTRTEAIIPRQELKTVQAIKLAGAFDVDEQSADAEYMGKEIKVTGAVTSIGTNKAGVSYIILRGTGNYDPGLSIECVEGTIRLDIENVSIMANITVRGHVQGFQDTIKDVDDQRMLFNSTGKEIKLGGCSVVN